MVKKRLLSVEIGLWDAKTTVEPLFRSIIVSPKRHLTRSDLQVRLDCATIGYGIHWSRKIETSCLTHLLHAAGLAC